MESDRHYTAYGLHVRSAIELPYQPLMPAHGQPDVRIRLGAVPDRLERPHRVNPRGIWESAPNRFLFRLNGIARYLVADGADILVDPDGGSERQIGLHLVGSIFAALLQQRGIAAFHSSAVATPAGAALFLGKSGAGKSTLLAGLVDRGHAMLADDLTGVVLDAAGEPVALPAFPKMRLWDNTLDSLRWSEDDNKRVNENLEKYVVPAPRFHATSLAVGHVFIVFGDGTDVLELRAASKEDTLKWLLRYRYCARFMRGLRHEGQTFRIVATMVGRTPAITLRRPVGPLRLDALIDRVEALLDGQAAAPAPPAKLEREELQSASDYQRLGVGEKRL